MPFVHPIGGVPISPDANIWPQSGASNTTIVIESGTNLLLVWLRGPNSFVGPYIFDEYVSHNQGATWSLTGKSVDLSADFEDANFWCVTPDESIWYLGADGNTIRVRLGSDWTTEYTYTGTVNDFFINNPLQVVQRSDGTFLVIYVGYTAAIHGENMAVVFDIASNTFGLPFKLTPGDSIVSGPASLGPPTLRSDDSTLLLVNSVTGPNTYSVIISASNVVGVPLAIYTETDYRTTNTFAGSDPLTKDCYFLSIHLSDGFPYLSVYDELTNAWTTFPFDASTEQMKDFSSCCVWNGYLIVLYTDSVTGNIRIGTALLTNDLTLPASWTVTTVYNINTPSPTIPGFGAPPYGIATGNIISLASGAFTLQEYYGTGGNDIAIASFFQVNNTPPSPPTSSVPIILDVNSFQSVQLPNPVLVCGVRENPELQFQDPIGYPIPEPLKPVVNQLKVFGYSVEQSIPMAVDFEED